MKISMILILILGLFSCTQENDDVIQSFYMYPNPFSAEGSNKASFIISLNDSVSSAPLSITIRDQNNLIVWSYSTTVTGTYFDLSQLWGGENQNGLTVAPGVYQVKLVIGGGLTGEKEIEIMII